MFDSLIKALIEVLAPVVDKFKVKNPAAFAVVQAILFTVQYFLLNASEWGVFPENLEWVKTVLQVITWLLTALVGSRTFNYLKK